jgi:hypothetical protein
MVVGAFLQWPPTQLMKSNRLGDPRVSTHDAMVLLQLKKDTVVEVLGFSEPTANPERVS